MNNNHDANAPGLDPGASNYGDGASIPKLVAKESISDLGNARIFQALYHDRMAFTHEWGWVFYNGRFWEREGGEAKAREWAGEAVDRRIAAWKSIGGEDAKRAVERLECWFNKSRLDGILGIAAGMMRIPMSYFDADPYLLNAKNGVVDLRTGALLPHAPERRFTMWSPVHYDKSASSKLWDDTVTNITCNDEEMAGFLQMLAGYSATGSVSAQGFFYFLGEGANGKSLMTDLWAEVIGGFSYTGYAVRVPNETILGGSDRAVGAPSPDLLALKGKRLALFSEQCSSKALNTARIKDLSGGDAITARPPHGLQVTFVPTHSLICCGNHIPYVNESDHGFWRRMKVVPFKARFKPSRRGEELREPEHLTAILAWMVRGAVRLYRDGWSIPKAIDEATDICRRESDPLAQWVEECCVRFDGETWTTILFEHFNAWRMRRCEIGMSHSMFTRRLVKMGYPKRQSNGKPILRGLRLRSNE